MNKYGELGCSAPQPAKLKGAREKNKYGELGRSDPQPPNLGGTETRVRGHGNTTPHHIDKTTMIQEKIHLTHEIY